MQLTVLQENLSKGVGIVNRVVTTKAQLPVLANILLATEQGKVKLAATNLETGINLWLGAKIEKQGKITVPGKVLSETVASLPQEAVALTVEGEKLRLSCGKFKALINGISADEFPTIPSLKGKKKPEGVLVLDKEVAEASLGQVAVAAAQDESRPVFTGVKLEFGAEKIRLAATDGYRLSVKTIKEIKGLKKRKSLIVPARALMELTRVLAGAETEAREIKLAATEEEKQLILAVAETEIVTRILEGEFPDFDKIIPTTQTTAVELEKEEFEQAVRAAAVFAADSANIVKFKITDGGLVISANAPQIGENEVEVSAKKTGEKAEIAFNSRYLLEMLNVVKAERLRLELTGPLNPGVFRLVGDDSFLHIIMPVRVQG